MDGPLQIGTFLLGVYETPNNFTPTLCKLGGWPNKCRENFSK